jgi:hypothetical protein
MAITDAQVRKVIKTSMADISAQIATADTLLQAAFAQAALPLPPATLYDTIGTWLAAHYVAVTDVRLDSTRRSQYSSDYVENELGMGLLGTIWGQQACVLDTTGTLARMDPTAEMAKGEGTVDQAAIMDFL